MLFVYIKRHFVIQCSIWISLLYLLRIYTHFLFDNLNVNRKVPYNLPGALQWHWFVLIGLLSVYPCAVKRKEPPQYYLPILRKLGVLRIPS